MPVFEIREEERWTCIIDERYHAYQSYTVENVYQIEAESEEEAQRMYRDYGTHITEENEEYGDFYDSEYVESYGEIDREFEESEILEITNLSDQAPEEVVENLTQEEIKWEV